MKINISSHEGKIDNEALLGVELWMKENKERGCVKMQISF